VKEHAFLQARQRIRIVGIIELRENRRAVVLADQCERRRCFVGGRRRDGKSATPPSTMAPKRVRLILGMWNETSFMW